MKDTKKLIENGNVSLVDIRNIESYSISHIDGATHINNDNLNEYIREADLDAPLIVYCYHGLSSQPAGQFLIEQGFEEVYSLIGGYSAWQHEIDSEKP